MKTTAYFRCTRNRRDRQSISHDWIRRAVVAPDDEQVQSDGRIRRWKQIDESDGRWLRVVLLPDGETVHNAFFDRRYKGPTK